MALLTIIVLTVVQPGQERSRDEAPAVLVGAEPSDGQSDVAAPDEEVQEMHRALHEVGELCAADQESRPEGAVDRSLETILGFVRRYPEGRFQIDDETGTSLSLLLVMRDELRSCDPPALAAIEKLLPPRFKSTIAPGG